LLSSATQLVEIIPGSSRTRFRDWPENVRLHPGIGVHLHPGILFGFTPECCSESSRNRVHVPPDSPFHSKMTLGLNYLNYVSAENKNSDDRSDALGNPYYLLSSRGSRPMPAKAPLLALSAVSGVILGCFGFICLAICFDCGASWTEFFASVGFVIVGAAIARVSLWAFVMVVP
jgi:hypothetical protein